MGATNFLTGSGGFLQSILNGYAGIRIFIGRMEINNPRIPAQTYRLSISGIHFICILLTFFFSIYNEWNTCLF